MPGIIKDLVTLFLEAFLLYTPNLRNNYDAYLMLKECASYWPSIRTIEFYLAEMEWQDFEELGHSLIQFYVDDDDYFIMNVEVMELDQRIKILLSPDAYEILMSK